MQSTELAKDISCQKSGIYPRIEVRKWEKEGNPDWNFDLGPDPLTNSTPPPTPPPSPIQTSHGQLRLWIWVKIYPPSLLLSKIHGEPCIWSLETIRYVWWCMGIPFVYVPYVYWKMVAYQNVRPEGYPLVAWLTMKSKLCWFCWYTSNKWGSILKSILFYPILWALCWIKQSNWIQLKPVKHDQMAVKTILMSFSDRWSRSNGLLMNM